MRSHNASMPINVPKGMAVLDACAQTNRFSMKMRQKISPGKKRAVYAIVSQSQEETVDQLTMSVFFRQWTPPKVLYNLPEKYPEKRPAKTNKPMPTLTNPPRKLGFKTPKQLRINSPETIKKSCMPEPTNGANRPLYSGTRKTSP